MDSNVKYLLSLNAIRERATIVGDAAEAMTLVLSDGLYEIVLSRMDGVHLTMAQLLEAATRRSGRQIAARHRPGTKFSPILIKSDGTLF
jgi:hypothetical protein